MLQHTLAPDWNATSPLRHTWEGLINVDQFRWMVRRDMQEHIRLCQQELNAKHVRAVGMLCDEMRVLALDPKEYSVQDRKPRVNWQMVDYVIDSLLELGVNPMYTTSFMPSTMAAGNLTCFSTRSRTSQPKDHAEWAALIRNGVKHAIDRYGANIVRSWYFEVWNEPNLNSCFFEGSKEDFFRLWKTTYDAIKSVDASLRVGGPSTARGEWIADMVEFGRKNDCEPDYLITHVYNNDSPFAALSPFDGPQGDKTNQSPHFASRVIRGARKMMNDMGFKGEIHWNEWGRSWLPCDPVRESANEAAWVTKTMAEASQAADYFAYWCISDIYDQLGYGAETFHGNYGMLNLQGLRKPVYHAFQLLGRLGDIQAPLPATQTGEPPLTGVLATRKGAGYALLAYAFSEGDANAAELTEMSIALPKDARPTRFKLTRVDAAENNILASWRNIGAPDYLPHRQRDELRASNTLKSAPDSDVRFDPATAQVRFTMKTPGVALVEIE